MCIQTAKELDYKRRITWQKKIKQTERQLNFKFHQLEEKGREYPPPQINPIGSMDIKEISMQNQFFLIGLQSELSQQLQLHSAPC